MARNIARLMTIGWDLLVKAESRPAADGNSGRDPASSSPNFLAIQDRGASRPTGRGEIDLLQARLIGAE